MSLASWKKEFYRTPANEVSEKYALQHSLKKWIGLKPSNRKKHHVSLQDGVLTNDSDIKNVENYANYDFLEIDECSCALCQHFLHYDCEECPLVKAGVSCCTDDNSPFDLFVSSGRVSPMVRALEKAVKKGKTK